MILTNAEMKQYMTELSKFLDRRDKIGYAAARNTRILRASCAEYIERSEELIMQYGDPEIDENGNQTGRKFITVGSEAFNKYVSELEVYATISHDVDEIFTLSYDEVIGILSGEEILALDWMLED